MCRALGRCRSRLVGSLTAVTRFAFRLTPIWRQDIVIGLDSVIFNDLMSNLAWLFSIHDKDGGQSRAIGICGLVLTCLLFLWTLSVLTDGYLTKDEVLQLSESLLVRQYGCLKTKLYVCLRLLFTPSSFSGMSQATSTSAASPT